MLPWKRPEPHPDFEADARVLLDRVRADLDADRPLTFENRGIWSGKWTRRGQPRRLHKPKLAEPNLYLAQCVWCEHLREPRRAQNTSCERRHTDEDRTAHGERSSGDALRTL